jgi:hypothetical protein
MVHSGVMDDHDRLLSDLRVQLQELRGDVHAILVQVTATNGRVNKAELSDADLSARVEAIETFKTESMAMIRGAFWIITSIVSAGSVVWGVIQVITSMVKH